MDTKPVLNKTKNLFNQSARRAALAYANSELCGELHSLGARARAEAESCMAHNHEASRVLMAKGGA